jgi:DHA1 family inner membrane transport protein
MTDAGQPPSPVLAYLRLALLAVATFLVGTNAFVIAGLLPDIATGYGVTPTEVSYTITVYAAVVAVAAPLIAILLPRLSRRLLLAAGLALFSVGTAAAAFAPSFELFTISRVLAAFGAAALIPAATAAASDLLPAHQRGRALAIVSGGFAVASALGSPIGTAVGEYGGWRVPFVAIAAIGAVVAVAIGLLIGHQPAPPAVPFAQRFAPLKDHRITFALGAVLAGLTGMNIVYIFSSEIAASATGGSGSLLAILLLSYGVAGIVGNAVAGPLTDRLGSRTVVAVLLGGEIVALLVLPFVEGSLVGMIIVFAIWGLMASGTLVPIQHRLVTVDPAAAGLAMSWYATAMYLGIALAPPIGAAAFAVGGAFALPLFGAAVAAIAAIAFQLSYYRRRDRLVIKPSIGR